jgi:hypothetical protein
VININSQIDELYAVHILCKNIEHGIQYSNKPWKLFIPSNFVYAFFTFNTIYSFDWETSFEAKQIKGWVSDNNSDGQSNSPKESEKFKGYIRFLYKSLGEKFPDCYYTYLSEAIATVPNPTDELDQIVLDGRIDETLAESFKRHFNKIWEKSVKGKNHRESIEKIVYFVYCVRNNIFHGEKNTIQMMDDRQQKRLKIYSGILIALNQLLFDVAKQKIRWQCPLVKIDREKINQGINWKKLFIWSGFTFSLNDNEFDFRSETEQNRHYLRKIINEIGYGDCFDGVIFRPNVLGVDQKEIWLNAVDKLHGGAEGGSYDDLSIMDPYIGGIVRMINSLGFETDISCDGHGRKRNSLGLKDRSKSYVLDACLRAISKGKYGYSCSSINRVESLHLPRPEKSSNVFDRDYLLEVAELVYQNRDKILKLSSEMCA